MTVRPGAEPFARDGDDVGVLLLHGFTGNPSSLRPGAVVPRLPPVGNDVKQPGANEDAHDRIPSHALHSMLRGYRTVVADLPAVSQPLLLVRSTEDHVVPASSSALILDRVNSSRADEVILRDSGHVATIDNDAGETARRSPAFPSRWSRLSEPSDLGRAAPAVGPAGGNR